jgi:hypothetical protein
MIFEKIDSKFLVIFLIMPKYLYIYSRQKMRSITTIVPLTNSCTVKYICGVILHSSTRVRVQRPTKTGIFKKIVENPKIFRPPQDCLNCGGTGCSRC